MKMFSREWKSSKQRRKQRKYRLNAPLHIKQKFMTSTLSKDLRKKHKKRNLGLKKGYTVKILRGQFKKQTGKVVDIDLKRSRVNIEGIQQLKRDGTKAFYPLDPSNLQIIDFTIDDKKMRAKLEARSKK